jgi:hypothetical protein
MTVMSKFPHVEQFRNVIRRVKEVTRYAGKDENGDVIFNSAPLPKLKFHGTTKLHGTNAGVGILNDGTQWAQSRENIITPEKDNAGFATFAYKNREFFAKIRESIANQFDINDSTMYIYGEFAGSGIQKGVAVSQIEKTFFVFAVKIVPNDEDKKSYWIDLDELQYGMVW